MYRQRPSMLFSGALIAIVVGAASLTCSGQNLPASGTAGVDLFWASSSSGASSQMYAIALQLATAPIPIGPQVSNVPSRWSHRRRYLGALETEMTLATPLTVLTPMGGAVGQGGIHFLDARNGGIATGFVSTVNPPSYDIIVDEGLGYAFAACDDGAGSTTVYGFSFSTPGTLVPLSPATIAIPGAPAGGVCRMGIDPIAHELHVPTSTGVQVINLSSSAPHMTAATFHSLAPASPVTAPALFDLAGVPTWVVGTSTFTVAGNPIAAGYFAYGPAGTVGSGVFGTIPLLFPTRSYVQAAGTQELAVCSDGTRAYVYFLLRDPSPTAGFIRPSAVGCVSFVGLNAPTVGTLPCSDACGEPFAIPSVFNGRVAFESSQGPPFSFLPPDGSERLSIIYSPIDSLASQTPFGILATAGPLGGRISTKGMDRPLWSRDGTRVMAATSHFPGAPQPGVPGLEMFDVPANILINEFVGPHTVVQNNPFPNQSVLFPAAFNPRDAFLASSVAGFSFFGGVFNGGMASVMAFTFGEIGQLQTETTPFVQSPDVPNFPGLVPPAVLDATTPLVPVPPTFGARRTTFNLLPGLGLQGLVLTGEIGGQIIIEATGWNFLAQVGVTAGPLPTFHLGLPSGWLSSTEFLSL